MPRATRPPSLPPDLVDGLLDSLRRVSAVADLLGIAGTLSEPDRLRDRTVSEAAGIIGDETDRMLKLIHARDPSINPKPPQP
jgi:hypothetical protein